MTAFDDFWIIFFDLLSLIQDHTWLSEEHTLYLIIGSRACIHERS